MKHLSWAVTLIITTTAVFWSHIFFKEAIQAGQTQPQQSKKLLVEEPTMSGVTTKFSIVEEPFTSSMLHAFEQSLPKMAKEQDRVQTAAILYRYRRPAGRTYLIKQLKQKPEVSIGPVMAATVFTLKRDVTMLDSIVKVLSKNPELTPDFLLALADWQDPKISDALLKTFQTKPQDPYLALALARHGIKTVAPQMRKIHDAIPAGEMDKIYFAVALTKLETDKSDEMLSSLLSRLKSNPRAESEITNAFRDIKEKKAGPVFQAIIQDYLSKPKITTTANQVEQSEEVMAHVAEALAKTGDKSSDSLLSRLLLRLKKDPYPLSPQSRIARALVSLESAQGNLIVKKVMGDQWLQQEQAKSTLEPIPDSFLMFNDRFDAVFRAVPQE